MKKGKNKKRDLEKKLEKRQKKNDARKKEPEHVCGNCLLYNHAKSECKVAILLHGKEYHMPVHWKDKCHMEELGIPIEQVRWYVEDPKTGKQTKGKGVVKMEYPENFFGESKEEKKNDDDIEDISL